MENSISNQIGPDSLITHMVTIFPTDSASESERTRCPSDAYFYDPTDMLDRKFKNMAWTMIICALRYFDCDVWDMCRVLEGYGYRGSTGAIAAYIERKEFFTHTDERWHPRTGIIKYRRLQGAFKPSVEIEYERGLPVEMVFKCKRLRAPRDPTDSVLVQAADGRKICTVVAHGEVSCRIPSEKPRRRRTPESTDEDTDEDI